MTDYCDACGNNHEDDGGECPFCGDGDSPQLSILDRPTDYHKIGLGLEEIISHFNSLPNWKKQPSWKKPPNQWIQWNLKTGFNEAFSGTINHLFYKPHDSTYFRSDDIIEKEIEFELVSRQVQHKLIACGELVEGVKKGKWRYYRETLDFYTDPDDAMSMAGEIHYVNGIRHGKYIEYYGNGEICEGFYNEGAKEGRWIWYPYLKKDKIIKEKVFS
tara:strand:+ start:183 stop:830 length:648 start_codon:yes stop_codon:yes gene_type:complete